MRAAAHPPYGRSGLLHAGKEEGGRTFSQKTEPASTPALLPPARLPSARSGSWLGSSNRTFALAAQVSACETVAHGAIQPE